MAELQGSSMSVAQRLGEYTLGPELGHGAMSVVYRARRGSNEYAIKVMSSKHSWDGAGGHLQFRREAAAIARLSHSSLVRVVEVGEDRGRPYLVMDLAEGESLDKRIAKSPLTEPETVKLAKAIAEALIEVHRFGLVHRDIKPGNIMLSASGTATLIDFGLVTGTTGTHAVVGTLYYAAPEQLGVLKRAVGAPADLYSLGATLFECLAGAPPFTSDSHQNFIQLLATKRAPDVRERQPETRPALALIIAKLLSKDPDDRYQSARGLLADLTNLARLDEALRESGSVVLGGHDALVSPDHEIPLVGRKEELARLQRAWKSTLSGEAVFLQVEGEGGSGKTRLVRELVNAAIGQGALVLSSKCQELETVPFGPLREAAEQYATHVAKMPLTQRQEAVQRLRQAAGDRAALVKRLSPGLAMLLGNTEEMRALEPDAEQQRYYEALATFFRHLATPAVPLVLVIDDIQWLDEGSLRVLSRLAAGNAGHLLVLSTSRNTLNCADSLSRFVEAIGTRLSDRIELKPLRLKAVNELVAARLGGKPLDAIGVEKLASLTNGNAFAIGEYLRALLDAGVVGFQDGRWCVDRAALDAVELPKDVAALVVSRLYSLREDTSRLVGIAGVLGGRFSIDLLARLAGLPLEVIARSIEELVRAGLIERATSETFSFVHDRVREAAVERLSADERRSLHQMVAETLDVASDPTPDHLYALARHYSQGLTSKNPKRVAESNLAAGLLALEDHANEEAFELLDRAFEISRTTPGFEAMTIRLLEGLGRACAMTGRLDRAFDHLEEALRNATDKKDRFRLQYLLTLTYASQGRNDEALSALFRAFDIIGRPFPKTTIFQVVTLIWFWVLAFVLRVVGFGYGRAKGEERERRQVLSQLHYAGSMIALFQGRPVLMVQFVVRDVLNVHYLGPTAETAIAYAVYGAVLGTFQLKSVMERYVAQGMEIAQQIGDAAALSVVRAYRAVGTKWAGDLVQGNKMLVEALPELHRNVPGSWYAAMMICEQAYSYLHAGLSQAAIEHVRAHDSQLERTNNLMFRYNTRSVLYAEMMVSGEATEATELWAKLEEQYKPLAKTIYVRLARCIATLEVLIDQEETGPAVDEAIDAFHDLLSEDYYSNCARVLACYARLEQFHAAKSEAARKPARKKLERAIFALSLRAMVPVFKCHVYILKAVLARTDGHWDRARQLLNRAEKLVAACASRRGAYYIALERARSSRQLGDPSSAFFAQTAMEVATLERWRSKARRVRSEFGLQQERSTLNGTISTLNATGTETSTHIGKRSMDHARRYADALLQVSLASTATLDPEAQAKHALDEVSRVLGAERALLFLTDARDGELSLKASSGLDAGEAPISKTVVRRVVDTRAPVILTGTDEGEAMGSQSVVTYGLRSIIAAPLMLRERLLGVVYLDSRLAKGMFTTEDVDLLMGIASHIAIAIETARAVRLEAERSVLERNLDMLGAFESLLLPRAQTFSMPGARGGGFYQPAPRRGGDWWWHALQADGSILLALGDLSRQGVGAAMISGLVAGSFHTARSLRPEQSPRDVLEELDRRLKATGGRFQMTMSILRIDPAQRQLSCWSAGGTKLLLARGDQCEQLAVESTPLGARGPLELSELTAVFSRGDRVLLASDGVFELGGEWLSQTFSRLAQAGVSDLSAQLGEELNRALNGRAQHDDLTFISVEATEGN